VLPLVVAKGLKLEDWLEPVLDPIILPRGLS